MELYILHCLLVLCCCGIVLSVFVLCVLCQVVGFMALSCLCVCIWYSDLDVILFCGFIIILYCVCKLYLSLLFMFWGLWLFNLMVFI